MSGFTRLTLLYLLVGILSNCVSAQNSTTQLTTGIPTLTPGGPFTCSGSDVTYDADDLCDGSPLCPNENDEFMCDDYGSCSGIETSCLNSSSTCISLSSICDGVSDCADNTDERFCGPAMCSSSCSTCSTNGASCDVHGHGTVNETELRLPQTIRYLILTNFSDLKYGLPIHGQNFPLLTKLFLSNNNISYIGPGTFINTTSLRSLDLSNNALTTLEVGVFAYLSSLQRLDLSLNKIAVLPSNIFKDMPNLQYLDLKRNAISRINQGAFNGLNELKNLYLDFNQLQVVLKEFFTDLSSLVWLDLGNNQLTRISEGTFEHLTNLKDLILRNNNITIIEAGAFRGLNKVTGASFTRNNIKELRIGMLDGLTSVEWISFRGNPLTYIEPGTFENTTKILYLLLVEGNLVNLHPDMFRGITNLYRLSTDDYRLCCLFDNTDACTVAQRSSLDSCTRLMPNTVLRVAMWILGFGALIGNTIVIILRCRRRLEKSQHEQPFFISNLAIADWTMGVFMIIIASADIYYGEYYFLYAPNWRASPLCSFAGFIAIFSSESSVFLLTIITVDRFISVVFPFSPLKFQKRSALICVGLMWVITFILGLVPIVVGSFVDGFYGLSDVCIGLPLSVDSTATGSLVWSHALAISTYEVDDEGGFQPSWIYSIVLFLGVNLICFLFILLCYITIFVHVRRSAKSIGIARHSSEAASMQEIKIAAKMALIIGTDFFCWMPVIIMGILSQTGLVKLPVSLYAWSAVFILPINASLNPYLYTFTAFIGMKKRAKNRQRSMNTCSTVTGCKRQEENTKL